jgi:poly(A) polymerase
MIGGIFARLLQPRAKREIYPAERHKLRVEQIDQSALQVVRRLQDAGFDAFIVGGAVRDLLFHRRPKDFDVATNATPEQVKPLFKRAYIIGRRFRLVHVHIGHDVIEVSTFRSHNDNTETDDFGRLLSDNVYGTQEEDAVRRDFTINALYYNPTTQEIWDYVGGVKDIKSKRLKLIGTPSVRYREDPVRMLRAVRLSVKLGLTIAPSSEKPIFKFAPLMEHIPPARLFEETQKLLLTGCAQQAIREVRRYHLMPALDDLIETPEARRFCSSSLKHTDDRLMSGRTVSPAYLFASLLWPSVARLRDERIKAGEKDVPALIDSADEILETKARKLQVPRRFCGIIREIWLLQPRFELRGGQRPFRLLEQQRFRAGYDFLCLRIENGDAPEELGKWWEAFQNADGSQRAKLQQTLSASGEGKTGGRSRRRRRKKPAESAE